MINFKSLFFSICVQCLTSFPFVFSAVFFLSCTDFAASHRFWCCISILTWFGIFFHFTEICSLTYVFCSSLRVSQFLDMCSNALVRHRHIKDYYVILAGWCLYHYVLPFFIPGDFSWCEVCSVWTDTAPPAIFWLVLERFLFLHPFTFHLYMSLYLK